MCRVVTFVGVLAAASLVPMLSGAARAQQRVTHSRLWEGEFRDETLKQKAPKGGVITDAEAFAKWWKAWRPDEKVPEVDFKKEFAFVAIAYTKSERPVPFANLQGDDLRVNWDAARRGFGGWGYAIIIFDRKNVKKINGVALEAAEKKLDGPAR